MSALTRHRYKKFIVRLHVFDQVLGEVKLLEHHVEELLPVLALLRDPHGHGSDVAHVLQSPLFDRFEPKSKGQEQLAVIQVDVVQVLLLVCVQKLLDDDWRGLVHVHEL